MYGPLLVKFVREGNLYVFHSVTLEMKVIKEYIFYIIWKTLSFSDIKCDYFFFANKQILLYMYMYFKMGRFFLGKNTF